MIIRSELTTITESGAVAVETGFPHTRAHPERPMEDPRASLYPLFGCSRTPIYALGPLPADLRVYGRALLEDEIKALATMHTVAPAAP